MGEPSSENRSRILKLNPCVLHLQKMELELKCPLCLNLLSQPMLLPCNHLFCSSCLTNSISYDLCCPACTTSFLRKDLRMAPHIETMVTIYKCMNAALGSNFLQRSSQANNFGIKDEQLEGLHVVSKENVIKTKSSNNEKDIINIQAGVYGSPLISGAKDSDDDSNDPGSAHKEQISCKRDLAHDISPVTRDAPQPTRDDPSRRCFTRSNETISDVPQREPKRAKLNNEPDNKVAGTSNDVDQLQVATHNLISNRNTESTHVEILSLPMPNSSNSPDSSNELSCMFCHSSKNSEAFGPMLHYADEKSVTSGQVIPSNVLHVHRKCIDWAPQVYFVGDIAKNLSSEISRASKIKCCKCGQKGAALGCYAKSCRKSFHPSCAVEIKGCRWDDDDFLLLCPAHYSKKFPSDRSKVVKKKSKLIQSPGMEIEESKSAQNPLVQSKELGVHDLCLYSSETSRNLVLCGSALSKKENLFMENFATMTGARVSKDFNADVTHVIASTKESGACTRTLKYLLGILSGKWILNFHWLNACMEARHHVSEEPYEISHDIHDMFDGPRNGRARLMEKALPLFSGSGFYIIDQFPPSYRGFLEQIISSGGGTILERNDLSSNSSSASASFSTSYVIYNSHCHPKDQTDGNEGIIPEVARDLASHNGSHVVNHEWLLDSAAACKLQPLNFSTSSLL